MKKNNQLIKLLIILFLFLSCSFLGVKKSYAIYRNSLNTTIHLSVLDPNTAVTITLNAHGGDCSEDSIDRTINQPVGIIPTPTRANYNFLGWYTTAETGGVKFDADTVVTGAVTELHARWAKIVCKKAVDGTLHQETCASSGSCQTFGPYEDDIIKYGTIPGNNSPLSGDAYDCDVDNDGVYSPTTERFYFIREMIDDDSDTAALVHFTSFDEDGQMDSSSGRGSYAYATAMSYLPDSTMWDNPALISFNGSPTRFIQLEDLYETCGGSTPASIHFSTCQYYLEHSRFQSADLGRAGIWLELEDGSNNHYRIQTQSLTVTTGNSNTARPVIEIPYNTIEGFKLRTSYNVTFSFQDGVTNSEIWTRYENQAVGSFPTVPAREGYHFIGWVDGNNNPVTVDTVITGHVTFYAVWEEVIENLQYVFRIPGSCTFNGSSANVSGDTCISTVNPTGEEIDYTESPNQAKYIDTLVSLYSNDNYDKDYEVGFTIVDYNGSSQANQASLFNTKLEYNVNSYNYPGLVFRRSNATKFEISTTSNKINAKPIFDVGNSGVITSAHPVNVIIKRESGVIKYSYNDGEFVDVQTLSGDYDHFNFHAWFGAAGTAAGLEDTTASATRIFAGTLSNMYIKMTPDTIVQHEITFVGGEDATVTPFVKKNVNHGSAIGQLPTATKSGFAFDGWWTQASGGSEIDENTIIGSDKTYYAHWKDIYLVTFYPGTNGTVTYTGSMSFQQNTIQVVDGGTIDVLPTAAKSGYVFDGWYTAPEGQNGTKITGSEVISADTDYYAHYKEIFDVTFYPGTNGTVTYTGSMTFQQNTIQVVDGGTIDVLPTATKSGVAFDGWYTAPDGQGGTKITGSEVITADTDYYAHYKQVFEVTFLTYGGTLVYNGSLSLNQNVLSVGDGDTIDELPTANKENSIFMGWYTAETGGTQITGNETISANTTYHARYSQQATVTFSPGQDVLDAEIDPFDTKTVAVGSSVGALPTATRPRYNFLGWYTDTTWTTAVDPDGTIVNNDVTYVARWEFNDYEAMIGSTKYVTLDAAIAAVPTTDVKTTVVLLKDVELTSTITIAANKNISFDLQNHTISGSDIILFANSGTVEVTNGTITNIGVDTKDDKYYAFNNLAGSKLYLPTGGALVTNHPKSNTISNNGYIEITGGTITSYNAQGAAINNNISASVIRISSGSIITSHNYKNQAIYNNGGTVYVSGDAYLENKSINNANGRAALHNNAGTMYITGGTIVSKANSAVKNNGTMVIGTDDSTFDNTSPVMQGDIYGLETVSGHPVTIHDGIFKGKDTSSAGNKAISNESYITYDTTSAELVHEFETIGGVQYDTAYLSSLTPTTSYTVTFDENNGSIVGNDPNSITVNEGAAIGTLPKAEKANSEFLGWFTSTTGGEKLLPTTVIDSDITYHARYTTSMTVCRPASTLHSSGNTDFGQIHSGSMLSAGDAYDCDVNGDGTFDATNERFYYLTDNEDRAVFIYSNNVTQSNDNATPSCSANGVSYGEDASHGPTTAMESLPTNSQWVNVSIYTDPRDIKNSAGTTVVSDYVYTGKAARFATLDEIKAATVSTLNGTANELASYPFLLENTISYDASCRSNYWLDTPLNSTNIERVDGSTSGKMIGNSNGTSAIRPVIEVPYTVIQGAVQMVVFDTLSPAMRNYFDNISTWSAGQTDSSHSSFDTYMTNNLDNNKCVYFTSDNRDNEVNYSSGWNVYCDQPNQYDTGVTGNVNVYEYNETTGTVSNSVASYVTANNGKLYNFIPNQAYYWESATDSSKNGYVKPIGERRVISIDNTTPTPQPKYKMRNVRDLGGIKVDSDGDGTIDGTIKYGKLFRSEKIWGDENATAPYLTKLGINHELDLRANSEPVTSNEDNSLPKITSDPGNASNTVFEIIHYGIDYTNNYSNYVKARDATARVMYEFVNAHNNGDDTYSLIFHCRIGADRTGTLAYLLEGLLGAPDEERYRDYELTVFFGLRERTRFYFNKGSNEVKFQYLKQAIRNAGDGVTEDVETWFLKDGNTATVKQYNSQTQQVDNITVNLPDLIDDFKEIMIDSY